MEQGKLADCLACPLGLLCATQHTTTLWTCHDCGSLVCIVVQNTRRNTALSSLYPLCQQQPDDALMSLMHTIDKSTLCCEEGLTRGKTLCEGCLGII